MTISGIFPRLSENYCERREYSMNDRAIEITEDDELMMDTDEFWIRNLAISLALTVARPLLV